MCALRSRQTITHRSSPGVVARRRVPRLPCRVGALIVHELRSPLPAPRRAPVARALADSMPPRCRRAPCPCRCCPSRTARRSRLATAYRPWRRAGPGGGGGAAGGGSRQPRRAADPLLRVRRRPVHPRVRAVRAGRRSPVGGHLHSLTALGARRSASGLRALQLTAERSFAMWRGAFKPRGPATIGTRDPGPPQFALSARTRRATAPGRRPARAACRSAGGGASPYARSPGW